MNGSSGMRKWWYPSPETPERFRLQVEKIKSEMLFFLGDLHLQRLLNAALTPCSNLRSPSPSFPSASRLPPKSHGKRPIGDVESEMSGNAFATCPNLDGGFHFVKRVDPRTPVDLRKNVRLLLQLSPPRSGIATLAQRKTYCYKDGKRNTITQGQPVRDQENQLEILSRTKYRIWTPNFLFLGTVSEFRPVFVEMPIALLSYLDQSEVARSCCLAFMSSEDAANPLFHMFRENQ
nr:hypothetical protein Iba_chr11aCG14970 [Ipomoea batatas]